MVSVRDRLKRLLAHLLARAVWLGEPPSTVRWSRHVFGASRDRLDADSEQREFTKGGRLTSVDGRLPWMVFRRDSGAFGRGSPEWRIEAIDPLVGHPFRYRLSGRVSLLALTLTRSDSAWRVAERGRTPCMPHWAMFAIIRPTRGRP